MDPFTPQTKLEALAQEIARVFRDENNLAIYLHICHTYPEHAIHRAFGQVKHMPRAAIRKSRGALFTYLTKKYAQEEPVIEGTRS